MIPTLPPLLTDQLCDYRLTSFADRGQILACTCHFERQRGNGSYVTVFQTKKEGLKIYIDTGTGENYRA